MSGSGDWLVSAGSVAEWKAVKRMHAATIERCVNAILDIRVDAMDTEFDRGVEHFRQRVIETLDQLPDAFLYVVDADATT